MSTEVFVDHGASADYIRKLRALADDIEQAAPGYASAILTAFTQDASRGTATGEVAPIYAEAVAAMKTLSITLETHFLELARTIRSDAAALELAVAEVAETDESGATDVGAVGDIDSSEGHVTRDLTDRPGGGDAVGDISTDGGYVYKPNDVAGTPRPSPFVDLGSLGLGLGGPVGDIDSSEGTQTKPDDY